MKKTMITGLVLLVLLAFAGCAALAEEMDSASSTASITFTPGDLEFVDASISGIQNMNIDFGSNDIPLGEANYTAVSGPHTLRVSDPTTPTQGWQVTAKLDKFLSSQGGSTNTFKGTITLKDSTQRITNNPTPTGTLTVPSSITLASEAVATLVMEATANFDRGWFDVTWSSDNITLSIDETNALEILDNAEYSANITWTLVVSIV